MSREDRGKETRGNRKGGNNGRMKWKGGEKWKGEERGRERRGGDQRE